MRKELAHAEDGARGVLHEGPAAVQHTPGPWVCYADLPSTEPNWHIVTNASRMRVLANVHIEPGNKVDEANARLITAAPDLLGALKQITTNYVAALNASGADVDQKSVVKARAAIEKAEGLSPRQPDREAGGTT